MIADADETTQPIYTIPWVDLPLVPAGWPANIPPAPHTITRWANRERQRIRRRKWLRYAAEAAATAGVLGVGYVLVASLVTTLVADALGVAAALLGGTS